MKLWTSATSALAGACAMATTCSAVAQSPAHMAMGQRPAAECRPAYPPAAVRANVQGVTGLAFHVDATGKVTQVDIVKSSGPTREHRLLDEAAASALSLCPFKAAVGEDGQAIEAVVPISYTWRLE